MRRFLLTLMTLFLVAVAGFAAWTLVGPLIENAARYTRLLAEPAPSAGSLSLPLPGVRFADTWGAARSEGRRHEGVDIFSPRGTPIHSATAGVVGKVGPDRLGGRTVTITGPGGYHHYYAHLDRYPALSTGDWVEVGTVVGYVGNSGDAEGLPTHLHYGVYTPSWQAVNPYPLLDRVPLASGE